jgi:hypothetical protein
LLSAATNSGSSASARRQASIASAGLPCEQEGRDKIAVRLSEVGRERGAKALARAPGERASGRFAATRDTGKSGARRHIRIRALS